MNNLPKHILHLGILICFIIPHSVQAIHKTTLKTDDNKQYPALIAGPENSRLGVVVVHDWFGITDLTRVSVNRLAEQGMRVIAVDLYQGQSATTHDQAKALQKALDTQYAQQAILAAVKTLHSNNRRVILVGYSAGAKFALTAAAESHHNVHAAALIYGGGYGTLEQHQLANIGPVLAIYGSDDKWSRSSFLQLNEQMNNAQKNIETYVYPNAKHAFAQKLFNGGKNLDPMATKAMRHVLDGFLARHAQ